MVDRKIADPSQNPFAAPPAGPAVVGFGVRNPELLGTLYAAQRAQAKAFGARAKPARPPDALRIFVGGGFDNRYGENMKGYYERYLDSGAGPAEYYTHLSVPSIAGAIRRANEDGIPVDIVGHSYGAMAAFNAANVAGQQGLRVRNLVTADPVGRLATGDGPLPAGAVARWVNINADPPRDRLADRFNLSDLVARLGGKPSAVPTNYADSDFTVRRHHQDLAGMMQDAQVDAIFAGTDGPWGDDLDGLEWNRRRNVQVQKAARGRR